MEDHGIQLAFGETVKAVEGETKVERIVTDKNAYDVDMVVLAVGFRPNTALGAGKLETFRMVLTLLIRNKKHQLRMFTLLVIVLRFMTMLLTMSTTLP